VRRAESAQACCSARRGCAAGARRGSERRGQRELQRGRHEDALGRVASGSCAGWARRGRLLRVRAGRGWLLSKQREQARVFFSVPKVARYTGMQSRVGVVWLPEPAVLPGDGCRQPLTARRQAPRGPRLLQPAPRSVPFLSNSRPVDLLASGVRACFVHAG
jgi:hypothetical protein